MAKDNKRTEVNRLISQGKEKGYLTSQEVNDVLPPDVVSPEQLDDLMLLFGELDIELIAFHSKNCILRYGSRAKGRTELNRTNESAGRIEEVVNRELRLVQGNRQFGKQRIRPEVRTFDQHGSSW